MTRLIRFNMFSFASRLTTYIIPLITLVVASLTAIIFSILPGVNFINKDLTLPILFFFSMVFLIQSTIIFFRLPQEESLLTIMVTKPYSKRKIYFSHLISNEITILLFSLYIGGIFTIIGAIDGNVSGKDLGLFFASALVGNIVIMTIFASLISLTCLVMSASWNTLIWMMIIFIIPISSFIGKATLNQKFTSALTYNYNIVGQNGDAVTGSAEQVYLDRRFKPTDTQSTSFDKASNNPYSTFAWFDPWYQLSDIYSVFRPHTTNWDMAKWSDEEVPLSGAYKITLDNNKTGEIDHEYSLIARNSYSIISQQTLDYLKTSNDFRTWLDQTHRTEISSWPIERQIYLFDKVIEEGIEAITIPGRLEDNYNQANPNIAGSDNDTTVVTSIDNYSLEAYLYFVDNHVLSQATTTNVMWTSADEGNFVWIDDPMPNGVRDPLAAKAAAGVMLVDEESIKIFVPSRFVDSEWILIIWSSIFVITFIGGILIYTRKEIINI